jgi:hypothetical protein
MAFGTRSTGPVTASAIAPAPPSLAGQPCGSLARVLARVFREAKPDILVLGPFCGESVVYLAGRGARVHVEDFDPPEPGPEKKPGEAVSTAPPFHLDQPDRRFGLVLAWEVLDFVPPDRLQEFGAELRRVLRDDGTLFLFSHAKPIATHEPPARYRVLADDVIVRESPTNLVRIRYTHPTREIERALRGLAVQGIHLQRSQMREIVAIKAGVG